MRNSGATQFIHNGSRERLLAQRILGKLRSKATHIDSPLEHANQAGPGQRREGYHSAKLTDVDPTCTSDWDLAVRTPTRNKLTVEHTIGKCVAQNGVAVKLSWSMKRMPPACAHRGTKAH